MNNNLEVLKFIAETLVKSNEFIAIVIDMDKERPAFFGTKNLCKACIRENLFRVVESTFEKDPEWEEDCRAKGGVKSPYINVIKKQ